MTSTFYHYGKQGGKVYEFFLLCSLSVCFFGCLQLENTGNKRKEGILGFDCFVCRKLEMWM
jgi:hypothetical protein